MWGVFDAPFIKIHVAKFSTSFQWNCKHLESRKPAEAMTQKGGLIGYTVFWWSCFDLKLRSSSAYNFEWAMEVESDKEKKISGQPSL